MPHVITEKCLGEVYAACAQVCPVECIHPGKYRGEDFMVIDPEVCIDCGTCLQECPIGAIVGSVEEDPSWARINAELAPQFKDAPKPQPRPPNDPPRKPGNTRVR
jgi:ferredoxin